jgi:transposase
MACNDVEALVALINRARVKLVASGSNSPVAMICYEAGYEGFWLYRRLIGLGIRVVVIDPASLLVDRRAKRAKTDRIDARAMVRALMAWARGERQVLSEDRVPTVEQDDARRGLRERQALGEGANGSWERDQRFAENTRDHGLRSPGRGCGGTP